MTGEELRSLADRTSASNAVFMLSNEVNIEIPISSDLEEASTEELNLSVRSRNGLMRAKLQTIGDIIRTIMSDGGLNAVRNLGKKSIHEIKCAILDAAYEALDDENREKFMERIITINS